MLDYEKTLDPKFEFIAGCDEAGRGCLAGELVVACVILPRNYANSKINDSKKLTKVKRQALFDEIIQNALDYQIIVRSVKDINQSNPKAESKLGMKLAVQNLKLKPDLVITDFEKIDLDINQINLVKGDSLSLNVAAASILAKVTKDNLMTKHALTYPEYDFENNQGYGTKKHLEALQKHGITPIHRLKYKPIANLTIKDKF
ncbi:ribonuclease HII [Mycoplasma nasistruthionis]|uniref:Ribonuclease HII n=1 Tax=Mycoplasma nasistruthionis TaxID=353852 RepID=A0A4Y6I6G6_9MOLU|nr:ribonuclease HII [Mycoplasma nasistruthionis]QDF65235.1 ribonuclease HII [Mycoplasma nasistruthionis]